MPRRKLPPSIETFGRQLLVGFGKIANRAIASGAKSIVEDVDKAGAEIRARADRAKRKIEQFLSEE